MKGYRRLSPRRRGVRPVPRHTGPLSLGVWANTGGTAGLNIHAQEFIGGLRAEGYSVAHAGDSGCSRRGKKTHSHGLIMGLPWFWRPSRMRARERIGYMVYEAERVPLSYVRIARGLHRVWTASRFGVDVLRRSGVPEPIEVVPGGVNTEVFFPNGDSDRRDGPWVFTAIGKPEGRKNYEGLLRAYHAAFSAADDVVLRILAGGDGQGRAFLSRILGSTTGTSPAAVELLRPLPDARAVADLLRSTDVFVLPTHGEGWGLPILEAMACGCCVITTNWSAPRDFVTSETGLLLDYRMVKASCPFFGNMFRNVRWAEPNHDQLVHYLRWTYEHRDEARSVGRRAVEDVRARWTWRHAARRAWSLLERPA